ncbi:Tyrosine-protein kinase ptk [bacterium HR19]|nr:Tyrosine-protein kinase ptk [bacterium HR19]
MEELTLRDFLNSIYKWRKYVVLTSLIMFCIVFGLQQLSGEREKVYKATASCRVSQTSYIPVILRDIGIDIKPIKFNLEEEVIKVKSEENLKEALAILGWQESEQNIKKLRDMLEVSSERNGIINISAYSSSPYEAQAVANAVAEAYVKNSKKWFHQSIENALNFLKESSDEISQKLKDSYSKLSEFSQNTGIVDPDLQIKEEINRIKDLQTKIYENQLKINMIERFFEDVSRNKQKTSEALRNLESLFMQDSIPEGKEMVEKVKSKAASLLSIDKSISSYYLKYLELEDKRKELLSKYSESHPKVKEIDKQIEDIFSNIVYNLKVLLADLRSQNQSAMREIDEARKNIGYISKNISEYLYISNNIDLLNKIFENYYNNLAELKMTMGMWSYFSEIYKRASLPQNPVSRLKINLILSLIASFISGIVIALILESIDMRFKNVDEIQSYVKVSPIAFVPKFEKISSYLAEDNPATFESMRRIRVTLQIRNGKRFSVLITSSSDNEGKTFVSLNLGLSFQGTGLKVAILDLNLSHPVLSQTVVLPEEKSLFDIIASEYEPLYVIKKAGFEFRENIFVFGSQRGFFSPDILSSPAFERFLKELSERFDVIIADSSPVLILPDVLPIVSKFDLALVVFDITSTGRKTLKRLIETLKDVGAKDIKIVVNKLSREFAPELPIAKNNYYYYYYRNNRKEKS